MTNNQHKDKFKLEITVIHKSKYWARTNFAMVESKEQIRRTTIVYQCFEACKLVYKQQGHKYRLHI
jgi:hypothetical protein